MINWIKKNHFSKYLWIPICFFAIILLTSCSNQNNNQPEQTPIVELTKETDKSNQQEEQEILDQIQVPLTIWAPEEELMIYENYDTSLLEMMCEQFQKKKKEWNIDFQYVVCPENKIVNSIKENTEYLPDLLFFSRTQFEQLKQDGILSPIILGMDSLIQKNETEAIEAVSSVEEERLLYAVPYAKESMVLYYNKNQLHNSNISSLEQIMSHKTKEKQYNLAIPLDDINYLAAFFLGAGCELSEKNGGISCNFSNKTGAAVTEYLLDLCSNSRFLASGDKNTILDKMKAGNCAAMIADTSIAPQVKKALGKNYAVAKLPSYTLKIDKKKKECNLVSFVQYHYIGVHTNTKYPELAQELVGYLTNKKFQTLRFEVRSAVPTRNDLQKKDKLSQVLAESQQVKNNRPYLSDTLIEHFYDPATAFGKSLMNGEIKKKNLKEQLSIFTENILYSD